jgi:hypothetical protein
MPSSSITQRLASLENLSKPALCGLWQQVFRSEPPCKMRKELLVRVIAYRLQEQEFGGMNDSQRRRLHQLASALETNPNARISSRPLIKPGTRLIREWKEQIHVVEIDEKGYQYKGSRYDSLSAIARLITGTRWSGPLFFGLKNQPSNESRGVQ